MEIVIISLLAGCLLGASNIITEKWIGHLDKIVMAIVFVILTTMVPFLIPLLLAIY